MTSDERLRFLASRPGRDGLARLAETVGGRGTKVVRVRRLRGGVDSATHAVLLDPCGWVVLKRSWWPTGYRIAGEHERLGVAGAVGVPTPEPLALDVDGDWFGRPALVMSRVAGRVREPAGGSWPAQLAGTLAQIHRTTVPDPAPASLCEPHAWQVWTPARDGSLRCSARLDAVHAAAASLTRDLRRSPPPQVLTHHDFHWRNVTWVRGRLAAVLDWNEARLGPAVSDVAYCSVDLAMSHGAGAADCFVREYETAVGAPLVDLARWQLLWIANALRWTEYFHASISQIDPSVTVLAMRRRLAALGDRCLASATSVRGDPEG